MFLSLGVPEASAQQYLSDAASSSSFGNNANTLTTMAPTSSTQGMPFGFGARVGGNKSSLAGWQAYRNYRTGPTSGRGTGGSSSEIARFGQVKMSFGSSVGLSYDTNVNNSPTDPLADSYITLSLNVGFYWKATRRNDLQLNFGLNYVQYFRYSQYNDNGILIDPYTGLDYRIYFQDFVLTLYDYPSITNNGGPESPAITNSVNFRQLSNRGGLSLMWHPNQLLFLTGVERSDTLSLTNDDFSSQNSTGYSWYGIVSYDITPTTNSGIRLQATTTTYTQQIMNDSVTAQAGIFYQSRLTDYTSFYFEAGIQAATFSNTGTQTDQLTLQETNGVNTNVEGTLGGTNYVQPYFQLVIMNRLTRYLTQRLAISREASGSTVSNYQEINAATYGLQYRINRTITASLYLNYEYGSISRTAGALPYSDFTGGLNFSFRIMKNTTAGVGFTYFQNEQSELDANYTRQVFTVSLSHQF